MKHITTLIAAIVAATTLSVSAHAEERKYGKDYKDLTMADIVQMMKEAYTHPASEQNLNDGTRFRKGAKTYYWGDFYYYVEYTIKEGGELSTWTLVEQNDTLDWWSVDKYGYWDWTNRIDTREW